MANLLKLFNIPLISYASTSAVLTDKGRFYNFARTVPPDNLQAEAIADIIKFFNWTYVSTVASAGDYGEEGVKALKQALNARNICISIESIVPELSREVHFEEILKKLGSSTAKVIALFLRVEDVTRLLQTAERLNITDTFVWIASDGWGKSPLPIKDSTRVSRGAFTIELKSQNVKNFDVKFKQRRPGKSLKNPWFNEFWESSHDCKWQPKENEQRCTGREIFPNFEQDSKVQFVYDTVYSVAYALHKVFVDKCLSKADKKKCMQKFSRNGKTFYKDYLLNVSFESRSFFFFFVYFNINKIFVKF